MKKIWCLFSIANNYDQPDNNLIAWWSEKPSAEILSILLECSKSLVTHLLDGSHERLGETIYRLQEVEEGKTIKE
jgi:hypothetical protein